MSLIARSCGTCGALRILSGGGEQEDGEKCPTCASADVDTLPLSGKGKLYSYTRVHVPTRLFQDAAPYWLVLVDLEEGRRVMGRLVEDGEAQPEVDAPVEIDSIDEGGSVFRLVRGG